MAISDIFSGHTQNKFCGQFRFPMQIKEPQHNRKQYNRVDFLSAVPLFN